MAIKRFFSGVPDTGAAAEAGREEVEIGGICIGKRIERGYLNSPNIVM